MRGGAVLRAAAWGGVAALGFARLAAAQGEPVFDVRVFVQGQKQSDQMREQAERLGAVYAKQIEQLAVAISQRDALRGARGLGELLNGPAEQAARRPAPATIEELLRSAAGASQIPGDFEELRALEARIRREVPLAGAEQVYGASASSATGRAYDRSQRTATANLALAEKSYHDAAARVQTYEQLLAQIDRAEDVKASSDLVARLLVENGLAMNELIRLSALGLAGSAAEQAGALAARENLTGLAQTRETKSSASPRIEESPVLKGVLR